VISVSIEVLQIPTVSHVDEVLEIMFNMSGLYSNIDSRESRVMGD
jgi:hypothetical protein